MKHEFKTRTNLFKPEALEILDSTEDGEDFLSMADLDSDWLEDGNTNHRKEEHPDTKLDQDRLNLQIKKINKMELNHNGGATTAQIQINKMAANQMMTTWLPGYVNNADMFSENLLDIIY